MVDCSVGMLLQGMILSVVVVMEIRQIKYLYPQLILGIISGNHSSLLRDNFFRLEFLTFMITSQCTHPVIFSYYFASCYMEVVQFFSWFLMLFGLSCSLQDFYVCSFSRFTTSCFIQHVGFSAFGFWTRENHGINPHALPDNSPSHKQCYYSSFHRSCHGS